MLRKLKWEGGFHLFAIPLSEEIPTYTRAVALLYSQSTAQVLEKRPCKPVHDATR